MMLFGLLMILGLGKGLVFRPDFGNDAFVPFDALVESGLGSITTVMLSKANFSVVREAKSSDFLVLNDFSSFLEALNADMGIKASSYNLSDSYVAAAMNGVKIIAGIGASPPKTYLRTIYRNNADVALFSPYGMLNGERGGRVTRVLGQNNDQVPSKIRSLNISISSNLTFASAIAFPSEPCRFVPLFGLQDTFNRRVGWGSSLVRWDPLSNYGNGSWLLIGVSSDSLILDPSGPVGEALVEAIESMSAPNAPCSSDPGICSCPDRNLRPKEWLKISRDGWHFVNETEGRVWFGMGVNIYRGPFLDWDDEVVNTASGIWDEIGLNMVRVFSDNPMDGIGPEVIGECLFDCMVEKNVKGVFHKASKNGDGPGAGNRDALVEHAKNLSRFLQGESAVMAVDLINEPYVYQVAEMKLNATTNETLGDLFDWKEAVGCNYSYWIQLLDQGGFSVFQNLTWGIASPVIPACVPIVGNSSAVLETYADWNLEVMKPILGGEQLFSIGFNSIESLFPNVQQKLDFLMQHSYPMGPLNTYPSNTWISTTLDRISFGQHLHNIPRPLVLAETGISLGDPLDMCNVAPKQPCKAPFVDSHSAAVLEMMPFFSALANGYAGVMRWRTFDMSYAGQIAKVYPYADPSNDVDYFKTLREGRFGLVASDGGNYYLKKPVFFAMKCFNSYLEAFPHLRDFTNATTQSWSGAGDFHITNDPSSPFEITYTFTESQTAFFVGTFQPFNASGVAVTPGLASNGQSAPSTVAYLWWTHESFSLCSSSDATISFNPSQLTKNSSYPNKWITTSILGGGLIVLGGKTLQKIYD